MSKNITKIKSAEIAKLANVSRSTVSRVINNPELVKEDTRKIVLETIEKYSYTPNYSAQILAGKKNNVVGLFIKLSENVSEKNLPSIHVDYLIRCVIDALSEHSYYTLVYTIYKSDTNFYEDKIKKMFNEGRISAGIFLGFPDNSKIIEELVEENFIVGFMDQEPKDIINKNRFVANLGEDVAYKQIKYLYQLGHRNIGIMHGNLEKYDGRVKYKSYQKAFKEFNLVLDSSNELFGDFTDKNAYSVSKKYLKNVKNLPTAFALANDVMCFGFIQALIEEGYKVPEDISIIGVDDVLLSSLFTPALTTFSINFNLVLKNIVNNLVSYINGMEAENYYVFNEPKLIERNSCKAITIK